LEIDASFCFNGGAVRVGLFNHVDVALEQPAQFAVATAVP